MIRAKDVWIIFKKVFCVISINKRDDCYNLLLIWIRLALTRDFLQEKSMIRSLVTFIEGIPRNKGNIVKLTLLSQAKDRLPFRTMLSSNRLSRSVSTISTGTASTGTASTGTPESDTDRFLDVDLLSDRLENVIGNRSSYNIYDPERISLLNIKKKRLAQHLTIVDFEIFLKISPSEILCMTWKKKPEEGPNVNSMIERSNRLGFWVATQILSQEDEKERGNIIEYFIGVGILLRKMNNFNGLMGLLSGLNMNTVSRLRLSWSLVSESSKRSLEELNSLMDAMNNYKNYRSELSTLTESWSGVGKSLIIPFLGIFLRDITFIDDGNANMVGGLINFNKIELIGTILYNIKLYQDVRCKFKCKPLLYNFVTKLPTLSDDMLYNLSVLHERKNSI